VKLAIGDPVLVIVVLAHDPPPLPVHRTAFVAPAYDDPGAIA